MNRLLGYLVTFLMLYLLLDGTLRLTGCSPQPVRVEFHETRGWQNRQSTITSSEGKEFDVQVAFNSKRMRGPEVADEKSEGTTRILFVGDSFTLGYTVAEEDLFLRILERGLRENGHQVECLNGGTEGYSTDQELLWLEQEGAALDPDYVVLAPYLNDIYWNSQDRYVHRAKCRFEAAGGGVRRVTGTLPDPGEKSWLRRHTGLGALLDKLEAAKASQPHVSGGDWLEDTPLLANEPPEIASAWRITEALVGEFANRVRNMGARPVALLVPNKWEIQEGVPLPAGLRSHDPSDLAPSRPTDRFKAACEAAGFEVVDPRPTLRARARTQPVYFEHDWHWNEAGNRVVASQLHAFFQATERLGAGEDRVRPETLAEMPEDGATAAVPTWVWIVGALWLLLGFAYARSYPRENPALAYLKVFLLIAFVVGVFLAVGKLVEVLPPSAGKWVMPAVVVLLIGFIVVKAGKRLAVIGELYTTFLRRGHWYLLPMLVVMLSIGMLLVVAASSPFVAPFIYTLF